MCKVITTFKKPMSTILLNQNFACQIETIHISLVNLLITEMTSVSQSNIRNCYGTAVYIKNELNCCKIPYRCNLNNLEITGIMVLSQPIPNIHVIGIYCLKTKVAISQLIDALTHLNIPYQLIEPTIPTALLGDFNIDLMQANTCTEQRALTKYLVTDKGYTQLINQYTTDYRTLIDHVYTNVSQCVQSAGTLKSYYSDHKPVYISLKAN